MFYCLLCILSFALSLSFCFIFNADLNLWPLVLKATTVLTCATTLFIFNLYFNSSFSSIWVKTWKPPLTVTYNCCKHLKITIAIKPNLGHTEQLLLVVLCNSAIWHWDAKALQFESCGNCIETSNCLILSFCDLRSHMSNNTCQRLLRSCDMLQKKSNKIIANSVTRLGDLLDFGQLLQSFGNN